MKSIMKKNCAIVALVLISTDRLNNQGVQAVKVTAGLENTNQIFSSEGEQHKNQAAGIFSKMIENVTEEENLQKEKDAAKERKRK